MQKVASFIVITVSFRRHHVGEVLGRPRAVVNLPSTVDRNRAFRVM